MFKLDEISNIGTTNIQKFIDYFGLSDLKEHKNKLVG